jgi:hypothetical protein
MIIFNGVDLTETLPVKIEDINVAPIQFEPVSRPRAIQYGSEFVRMRGSIRNITITFALLDINKDEREQFLQDLRNWASIGAERTLELPEFSNRHLECAVTSLPDHSYRKWWENKLRLVFTCFNNVFWTSNELVEVPCGNVFSIGGSAQPLVTIERSAVTPLTNQTYTDGTGSMFFSTLPAGNVVIDLNRQIASVDGVSIMQYYAPTSVWITPKVGAYQYINGAGVVKYRERWV